jgi:hypothetical protein
MKLRKAIKTIRILSRAPAASFVARALAEDRRALHAFDKAARRSLKAVTKRCVAALDVRSEASTIEDAAHAIVAGADPALMDPACALDHIADAAALELPALAGAHSRALCVALGVVRALAEEIHAARVEPLQARRAAAVLSAR